jgi:hypothetical protein
MDLDRAREEEQDPEDAQQKEDLEAAMAHAEEERREPISRQSTLIRSTTQLRQQRTGEEVALERRQVYGPGIPPFA